MDPSEKADDALNRRHQVSSLNRELKRVRLELKEAKIQTKTERDNYKKLCARYAKATEDIDHKKELVTQMRTKVSHTKKEIRDIRIKLAEEEEKSAKLRDRMLYCEKTIRDLKSDLEERKQVNADIRSSNLQLRKLVKILNGKMDLHKKKFDEVKNYNVQLQKELMKMKGTLSLEIEGKEKYKTHFHELKKEYKKESHKAVLKHQEYHNETERLHNQITFLKEQLCAKKVQDEENEIEIWVHPDIPTKKEKKTKTEITSQSNLVLLEENIY